MLFDIMFLVINMEYRLTMRSEMETIEFAQNLESEKFPNMVICLNGELGSGKTLFTKGFANALGIKEQLIFPEIEYDKVDKTRGMDIIFVTTAKTDEEARELLRLFNMPFQK